MRTVTEGEVRAPRLDARTLQASTSSYYRARYYDPTAGRFLSEDAIRFDAGINFYSMIPGVPPSAGDLKFAHLDVRNK